MAYNNGYHGFYYPHRPSASGAGNHQQQQEFQPFPIPMYSGQAQAPIAPYANAMQNNPLTHQANSAQAVHRPLPYAQSPGPFMAPGTAKAQPFSQPPKSSSPISNGRGKKLPDNVQRSSSAIMAAPKSKSTPKSAPEPSSADNSLLLITLAEEYFDAAYGVDLIKGPAKREPDYGVFCKLIATGLGCLEATLNERRLQPAMEASVRLKYASVLFQETENFAEAEETLSKGISHCERYRLHDLRYNMQHLLARVTFETNARAALKFLDGVIKDTEAEKRIPWIYALRLLRASLTLELPQAQEFLLAIGQLKQISMLAISQGDRAVAAMVAAIEALAHVHRSSAAESIEQAQRALAVARSSQLDQVAQGIHQLTILTLFVDISCNLRRDEFKQAGEKMKALHKVLEEHRDDKFWTHGSRILIPISSRSASIVATNGSSGGIIQPDAAGRPSLLITWLPKDEIYTLGYMMSAAVAINRNTVDRKAEEYFKEALVQIGSHPWPLHPSNPDESWRQILRLQVQTQLVFAMCTRNAWAAARKELTALKEVMTSMPPSSEAATRLFVQYLEGIISQGTGDTRTALSIFSSPELSLSSGSEIQQTPIRRDLSILATFNTVLIIHPRTHPKHALLPDILSSLDQLAPNHQSQNIRTAHNIIRALSLHTEDDGTIMKAKQYLSYSLRDAQLAENSQMMSIMFNFMSENFFREVFSPQAQKSAQSALNLSRKARNDMWVSVASNMLANVLEGLGKIAEAQQYKKEAMEIAANLPPAMRREAGSDEFES